MTLGLFHIIISEQHPPWGYFLVRIIQLVIMKILCLSLVMNMVKVVWILGLPILTPKDLIAVLIVMILCHIRVGKFIHESFILILVLLFIIS